MQLRAIDVMHSNVVTLRTQESVRRIVEVLQTTSHNAFPVNEADSQHFRGAHLRSCAHSLCGGGGLL